MGRNNSYVAASCLYTICRREKSPVMLIDFSDILQTPVKPLGKTFLKLLRLLHISVPNIDPSLYLERFAHKLNLKNAIYKVTYTGIKLIQAMTRDWICTGRRPTGLCGAALLISTRMHGIFVHSNTIANIVRISNPTIIKRLSEFKNTSTAKMKVSDFDRIRLNDLPSNSLPPCVIASNKKKLKQDMLRNNQTVSLCDSEDIFSTAGSAKSAKDSTGQLLSNETFSPNGNEDTLSLCNTMNITNEYDANNVLSYKNLNLLDSRSSCNGMEDVTTTECSVNGGSASKIGRSSELNSTISSCLPSGSTHGGSQTGDDGETLTNSATINVEEICNENPEGNDLDQLAKKIINTIDVEKQSSILKVDVSSFHMNNSQCDGSDSAEGSEKEKLPFSHSENGRHVKKENGLSDNPPTKSSVSIASINHLSDLDSCLTTPMGSAKELTQSNGTCHNGSSSPVSIEKHNASGLISADHKNDSLCKKGALLNGDEMEEGMDNLNNEHVTAYNSALKETLNSELSHLLNEVDDFNILQYANNAEENKRSNKTNDMHKDDLNHVSSILSDFNYFFENNSNTVESQTPNVADIPSDASIEQFNESLSEFYDSEIENIILSEKERRRKMLIWDDMMRSYFPQYYKQLKKEKKKKRSSYHPHRVVEDKSKKKKIMENDHPLEEQTAGDSVIMALEKSDKSMSTKMNYDVLKSLFSS
ncbi:hypothetical protein AK88_04968 [Plasmodium fragile]|uniref:Cyclin-like domain-containing protein n=1 Tax=Plasmodium fragile TaxID=5857 RepID=A0A0D9QEA9_PLAFR|nr:uncharacterized protein AK88_04968 [Plasmodium fragile]KJP85395.1 hypothetical protein AK88_04968 [Plasmodium fragile]